MRHRVHSVSAEALAHYRAHFLEALQEDGLVCLECGRLLRDLKSHLRWRHELSAEGYREKWGYNRTTALITPTLREALRQRALAQNLAALSPPDGIRRAMAARRAANAPARLETRLRRRAEHGSRRAAGWRPPARRKRVADASLEELVGEGLTVPEIAARTKLKPATVRLRLRALGLGRGGATPRVTDDELLTWRAAGLWPQEIAARTGLSVPAVENRLQRLKRRGVPVPAPAGPAPNAARKATDAQLLALAGEGLRALQIAARLGLSVSQANARLRVLRGRGRLPSRRNLDAEVLGLRQGGLESQEIAARTGLSKAAVDWRLRKLRRSGVPVPPPARSRRPRWRRAGDEELLALARAGLATRGIAARLGMSRSGVQKRLAALRRRGLLPAAPPPAQPL